MLCRDGSAGRTDSVRSPSEGTLMIPIRDANPTHRVPIISLALIAASVAVFLLW